MFKSCFFAASALLVTASPTAAQGPAPDSNAALFGARESAFGVDISPNGKFVSYVAPTRAGGAEAFIADVQTGNSKPFLSTGNGPERLSWCHFVTDQRLICRYTAIVDNSGVLLG